MSYTADLSAEQAYRMLLENPAATLVDVRTDAEWRYVGGPDMSAVPSRLVAAQWQSFPDDDPNPGFLDELAANSVNPAAPVLFLCRSGARSQAAAAAAAGAGYVATYNIVDGFEGPVDVDGHRGTIAGWKADGLPWRQS